MPLPYHYRQTGMVELYVPAIGGEKKATVDLDKVLCNDVILPWERGKEGLELKVIGTAMGAHCAVWATTDDALEIMHEYGFSDPWKVNIQEKPPADPDMIYTMGDGTDIDLTDLWIYPAEFELSRKSRPAWVHIMGTVALLCAFAEARGAGVSRLSELQ